MEREPSEASDYGVDLRDIGDEPPGSIRDAAPDILSPIDASSPVSGHIPAPDTPSTIADAPEQSWDAASEIIFPVVRAPGTQGLAIGEVNPEALAAEASRSHSQPLLDEGPVGLAVLYVLHAGGFDVIVNADHLLSWGVTTGTIQEAAMRNLADWSATAAWTDDVSGERRLISSETGDGWDAARILLPDVLARLGAELAPAGRVLVAVPERHLLVAATLRPDDLEFASLFTEFVVEASGGADEPVDRRVFELVDGRLVEAGGLPSPAG
jgi:hypothetical protein